MRLARFCLILCGLLADLSAAPPLTTVRDTVYTASAERFSGSVIIEWKSFEASDTSFIGRQRLVTDIQDGLLNVRLVPTTTAASPAYYSVRYVSNGNIQFSEYWAVPPSNTPMRVMNVRISDPLSGPLAGGAVLVEIADVNGLQAELDARPRKATGYSTSHAVVSNGSGELAPAVGSPDDCIRVDGTAGPCGSGSGSPVTGTFVDGETPGGAIDGANVVFTLSQTPNPSASLLLYRNGILQKRNLDYTLTGTTVSFVTLSVPQSGDILQASYRTAGTGGTLPQVLCTGSGAATAFTTSTSLGSCSIPAGLLANGDRIEVLFDYSHEGSLSGFSYAFNWGATPVTVRSLGNSTSLATGRVSLSVGPSRIQWGVQAWGTGLTPVNEISSATLDPALATTLDFMGNMTSATADTVTLRNFTVLRYPAP